VGYSPCGSYLVDASWEGKLLVRDVKTGTAAFSKQFPGEMITRVDRCCGGQKWFFLHSPIATTRDKPPENSYFAVWNWPFQAIAFQVLKKRYPFVRDFAVTPDGERMAVVYGAPPNSLEIIRTSDSSFVASLPVKSGGAPTELAWTPDKTVLASVQEGKVVFYSGIDFHVLSEIPAEYPSDVEFSPDGSSVAIGSASNGMLLKTSDVISGSGYLRTDKPVSRHRPKGRK